MNPFKTRVIHYDITKHKTIPGSENDTITERFTNLVEARKRGAHLFGIHNFKSLVNSNGVTLTL